MMIDDYTLIKCVGKGAFGEVYISSKKGSSKLFATKKVPKSKADSPAIKKYFLNEINILREISHPCIIHLETIKHTIHNYYIITEYCNGGDLLSCLKKYKSLYFTSFSEEIVQHLMRQIISAIKYLHSKRIIHRDLKLENILVNFDNDNDKASVNMLKAKIKVIDFGFATHLGASNLRYSTLGSPINMDPVLLNKLASKNGGGSNLIGYNEKADIWSLGTVCYELLIGQEVFNAQTMIDLIQKVEKGNYHVPTHLSKEVVSFLNGMLQYSAKTRLSAEELSRHKFLTKNVKEFKKLDLRKISHKVDSQGLNINIKRNQSIWAIFKEEDEKTLIDIPGKYYVESPIQELDELLNNNDINKKNENPFGKTINININNKMKHNIDNNLNNLSNNNEVNVIKDKEKAIDYDLLKKQQKLYYQINLDNNKYKRFANYVHNYPYGFGGTNNAKNNNNYYTVQPNYYTVNINSTNNTNNQISSQATNNTNNQISSQATNQVSPAQQINSNINNTNQVITQPAQKNNVLIQYPQYQYPYKTQPAYYTTNIQNIQTAPVKSNQDLISQGFYQTSPTQNISQKTNQIPSKKYTEPSNNYSKKINQIPLPIQNMQVQKPIIIPSDNTRNKSPSRQLNASKISAISNVTTKTINLPKGSRMPKPYHENYNNTIVDNHQHSKTPIKHQSSKEQKPSYHKQQTYNWNYNTNTQQINKNKNKTNAYDNTSNYNNKYDAMTFNHNSTKYVNKYAEPKNNLKNYENKYNENINIINTNQNKKPCEEKETYEIKYENYDFPETKNNYTKTKIKKLESPKNEYSDPLFYPNEKNPKDSIHKKPEKEESTDLFNNNTNNNDISKSSNSFPMPDKEDELSKEEKNDDSSENLDELIDFKLGDELCPVPEDEKFNDLDDDNDKDKENDFEKTMKKKIMERTVERPTLGVPPPGTNPNDNFEFDDDDDFNNGVFQTNKNNFGYNDDNFEI